MHHLLNLLQTVDDAKNLNLIVPMHNLLESSLNHSNIRGSFMVYSEATNFNSDIESTNILR